MTRYTNHLNNTPQSEPILGREAEMTLNNAGGYVFKADDWTRLDRFLILGTEGGSYYVGESKLTRENAGVVLRCIAEDGVRTVNRIVEVSDQGLAPKNDPAIFALALAAKNGNEATRSLAYKSLPKVCRIGTHLFQFADSINQLGGWGRGARNAVANWYTEKDPDKLAYQLVKYRQREGWSHADLLRLSHPKPSDKNANVLAWAAGKPKYEGLPVGVPTIVSAYEAAKVATLSETVQLINTYDLPREAINTEYLNEPQVLEALLQKMPMTALVRNLGNLTKAGVIAPFSDGTKRALEILGDEESLRKSRIHPMAIYLALMTYSSGRGIRGNGSWTPVQSIVDALNEAFYSTMPNVEPSGKRILFAIDTSRSMGGSHYGGYLDLSAPIAQAAAMALISAKMEQEYLLIGVDTSIQQVGITPNMRLDQAIKEASRHGGGGTDLSLPFRFAKQNGYKVDGFVTYTDNESWAGNRHAVEALADYRRVHPGTRNVNAAMVGNYWNVSDPNDPLSLSVVGLDASVPSVISNFTAGRF